MNESIHGVPSTFCSPEPAKEVTCFHSWEYYIPYIDLVAPREISDQMYSKTYTAIPVLPRGSRDKAGPISGRSQVGAEFRTVLSSVTAGVPSRSTWDSAPVRWSSGNCPKASQDPVVSLLVNLQGPGFGVETGAPQDRKECPGWSRLQEVGAWWD